MAKKKKTSKSSPVPDPLLESTPPPQEKFETTMTAPEIFALPHPNEDPAKLDAPFMMTRRMLLDIVEVMLKESHAEGYSEGYEVGKSEGVREALTHAVKTLGKGSTTKVLTANATTQASLAPIHVESGAQCTLIATNRADIPSALPHPTVADTSTPSSKPDIQIPDPPPPPLHHANSMLLVPSSSKPFSWADDVQDNPLPELPKHTPRDFSDLRSKSPSNPFATLHRRRRSPRIKKPPRSTESDHPKMAPVCAIDSTQFTGKVDRGSWVFIPSHILATVLGVHRRRGRRHVRKGCME